MGYAPYTLYSSPAQAVKDFAYNYYNVSLYIRYEISAVLYIVLKKKKNYKVYYAYTPYVIEKPHSCNALAAKKMIPKGYYAVGAIHTHPNSNSFSSTDKSFAKKKRLPIYVITPNKSIRVYHDTRRGWKDEVVYTKIKLKSLPRDFQKDLANSYRSKWKAHLKEGCNFKCKAKRWPAW